MAVPGTIRPATDGTMDTNGRWAPHGYAVRNPLIAGVTEVTLTTTAVASAPTLGSMVSVHPAASGAAGTPRPERVSTSRVGVSGVNRLAAPLAVTPATVEVVCEPHGSVGAGTDVSPTRWNQFDFRPIVALNVSPLMFTAPAEPLMRIVSTRPPHSPKPSRVFTTMPE